MLLFCGSLMYINVFVNALLPQALIELIFFVSSFVNFCVILKHKPLLTQTFKKYVCVFKLKLLKSSLQPKKNQIIWIFVQKVINKIVRIHKSSKLLWTLESFCFLNISCKQPRAPKIMY